MPPIQKNGLDLCMAARYPCVIVGLARNDREGQGIAGRARNDGGG